LPSKLLLSSVALLAALAAWAGTASPQATSTTKKKSTVKKRAPVVAHRAPQQPSPDRLKEIQQALASRGYFTGEPDGTWGPASIDALKRFQHDQNLVEDGKIGSLSLIALGLGPKRDAEQKAP
jgi:peptidoglycan hydrolase-like protein with peptidoglycan-binding domain